jgi:hypothetical protein
MTLSIPKLLPSRTDIGEKKPMHRTGIEVNKLATEAFIPKSLRMISSTGEMELIAGRKFREAKKRAVTMRPPAALGLIFLFGVIS